MFELIVRTFTLAYRANKFYVIALIANNIILAAVQLSAFYILARIIDLFVAYAQNSSSGLTTEIWWWFGALVLRWVVANICAQFFDYLADVHKPKILDWTDNQIIAKLDRLPTQVIESSAFQDTMTNIHTFSKNKFIENIDQVGSLVQSVARFVFAVIALMLSSPLVALLIIVVAVPEVRYNLLMIRKVRNLNEALALQRRSRSYFVSLTQDIGEYFNLKSFNLFPYFLGKVQKAQQSIIKGTRDIQAYYKPRSTAIGTLANLLGQFLPKGYYVWATLAGQVSIGQFQLYYRLVDEAYDSSYWLYRTYLEISENNIYVKDLFNLFDMAEAQTGERVRIDLNAIELEFKNVSFTYPESDQLVLQNVSFKVGKGEKLAIVGHNGAGKTTIARLINKFYAPTKGAILVNGVDLQLIDDTAWRAAISNLSQDVPRFYLSAKENVIIGDHASPFNKARYQQSIKQAKIAGDIVRLPQKDNNVLGKYFPGGVNFSGGQWQKLSIARSLYRQAGLLILDEPTSAVDSKAEQEIFEAIFAQSSQQAQVIISHKFSNIKKADHIIVIEYGQVLEHGTHKSLMAANKTYAALYNQQSSSFKD